MYGDMKVINAEALIKAFNDIKSGKEIGEISSKDFEIRQKETKPLPGYTFPEAFPNCCEYHKCIFKMGAEKYQNFPDCCEEHRKLKSAKWFNKDNYSYLPSKLVTTVSYTVHCISKCISNLNWFKEITDYIEYTKSSYGQFPDGYGSPLGAILYLSIIEERISSKKEVPEDKRTELIEFIKKYGKPQPLAEQADLNLLIGIYKQWLKSFPFEISFFNHLKPFFESQMPILGKKEGTNIYTGLTGYQIKTKKQLVGFLVSTTLSIIQRINTLILYKENLLNSIENAQMEVLTAKRRVELEELDKADWNNRKEYIKILKRWLDGEKKFLHELGSIARKKQDNPNFIDDLLHGINCLQKNDTNESCIMNIKQDRSGKETGFRYWFKNFFAARYKDASVTAEEEKGNGRIDLKISSKVLGTKIVEFKGWWNQDKINTAKQICSYLTDFEKDGYVFMINHLKSKEITSEYKALIACESTHYLLDSWKEHKVQNSDFFYYESKHQFATKEKVIYHFIFNVYN